MIEDLDAHERPCGSEASREGNVLRRRLRVARRVVVEEDEGGRARDHRLLEDLTRMNQRRRQAADRDHGLALEAVTNVEGEDAEGLDRPRAVARQEIACRIRGSAQRGQLASALRGQPRTQLQRRRDPRRLGAAESPLRFELAGGAAGQTAQAGPEEGGRDVESGSVPRPRAQHDGEELAVGEGARAVAQEPLARAVFRGQVEQAPPPIDGPGFARTGGRRGLPPGERKIGRPAE